MLFYYAKVYDTPEAFIFNDAALLADTVKEALCVRDAVIFRNKLALSTMSRFSLPSIFHLTTSLNLLCFNVLGEHPDSSKRKQIRTSCILMPPTYMPNTVENNNKSNGKLLLQSFTRAQKLGKVYVSCI